MNIKQLKEYISTLPDDAEIIVRLKDSDYEYNVADCWYSISSGKLILDLENILDDY